jgi:hypothetical protein
MGVAKVNELIGSSPDGFEEAVRLPTASKRPPGTSSRGRTARFGV